MIAGDIAVCSRGEVGLITSPFKKVVTYKICEHCHLYSVRENHGELVHVMACTCETGFAWTGIHLAGAKIGQPWSSRTPIKIGNIDELLADHQQTEKFFAALRGKTLNLDHLPEGSH